MIAIIDYGMGNVKSVYNAIEVLGEEAQIVREPEKIRDSNAIILPGVGAFKDGMNNLKKAGFIEILEEEVLDKQKPYLGICLGLEFLAEKSFEGGITDGFGWIKGNIKKIDTGDKNLKIPHIGWDDTVILNNSGLMKEINNPIFYYLHSYYFDIDQNENENIETICQYGKTKIISSIHKNNIFGVQFHPEKSQNVGLKLINNFLELSK